MIELDVLSVYALACAVIVVVPGPTVTVIVANSLRQGAGAGWLNIAGTQLGLLMMLVLLAAGFSTLVQHLSWFFDVVRIVGACYLIWLGWKMWRARGRGLSGAGDGSDTRSRASLFWQGFLVIWSNPKALFFFGAFLPQFVDQSREVMPQLMFLGIVFMLVGAVFDGAYAIAAGGAGGWLHGRRALYVERGSGCFLMAGGVWLLASGKASV